MKFALITFTFLALIFEASSQNTVKLVKNRVSINWEYHDSLSSFQVVVEPTVDTNFKDSWLAIGFNANAVMANAGVVVCRNNAKKSVTSVQHYLNTNAYNSFPLDRRNLSIGLSNARVNIVDGKLVCSFTRNNYINRQGYFRIAPEKKVFLVAAYGTGNTKTID